MSPHAGCVPRSACLMSGFSHPQTRLNGYLGFPPPARFEHLPGFSRGHLRPGWALTLPICGLSPSQGGLRLLIQESVWDDSMTRLRARMAHIRAGRGLDGAVDMGTRGAAAWDLAQRYICEAKSHGAQVSRGHGSGMPVEGRKYGPESWCLREEALGWGCWGREEKALGLDCQSEGEGLSLDPWI